MNFATRKSATPDFHPQQLVAEWLDSISETGEVSKGTNEDVEA